MSVKYIIVLEKDGIKETWGCLTSLCFAHEQIIYHSIKHKKFPFVYKGYKFEKIKHSSKTL